MNMIPLPDEDDETIEVFSSPCSAPPLEPVPEVPFYPQETPAEKTPAQETTTQEVPAEAPEPGDEEPAAAPVNGTPAQEFAIEEPVPVAAPDNENVVPLPVTQTDNGYKSFEKQAEDSFRMAFGGNPKAVDSIVSAAGEACQNVALAMRSSAEEWMTGFTRINRRLFEFGQLNAQNGMDFMRAISGARTVRDAVDAQTAYLRGQYDAMTSQLRELQTLTTEVAGKTAQPFKDQFTRAAQLGRMC